MKQHTEIYTVPTDHEAVDSMGFTWSNRDGQWGYTIPGAGDAKQWFPSYSAMHGRTTAFAGPFAEVEA